MDGGGGGRCEKTKKKEEGEEEGGEYSCEYDAPPSPAALLFA
jgi:hypothetical protein